MNYWWINFDVNIMVFLRYIYYELSSLCWAPSKRICGDASNENKFFAKEIFERKYASGNFLKKSVKQCSKTMYIIYTYIYQIKKLYIPNWPIKLSQRKLVYCLDINKIQLVLLYPIEKYIIYRRYIHWRFRRKK